jgi:rod shape-determining protein MreC
VVLTGGLLLILALHMLSAGVAPDARAAKPSIVLLYGLRPVLALESSLTDGTAAFVHDYLDLVGVRQENAELHSQLAKLQSERARLAELEAENSHLRDLLELREALGVEAVAANVIGSDATGLARTLVLSEGGRDGLKHDLAVVSSEGVVGKLVLVGPTASRVLLIDDHNSALDAFDQRSRARGIVAGVVDDGLTMKYVDRSEDIKPGDAIVTSGMDGIFPRGLLVGQVARISREGPGLFVNVEVKAAVDFRRLEQVLVLKQRPPVIAEERKG